MTADPTTLPQRTPGAALANACSAVAGMRGIGRCENGRTCDWHETRRLLREGECGCCIGRYGTCRNGTKADT